MNSMISIENGDVIGGLRSFLKAVLDTDVVDALFVPLETEKGAIVPTLVTDPAQLELANPLAPVMPINSARAVSAITGKKPPARIGAVLRPCEIRALIELVKLQQASLEGVTLIGLDCPGTFDVADYMARKGNGGFDLVNYLEAAQKGQEPAPEGLKLRSACQMCVQPVPSNVAIHLQLFGSDAKSGIPVEVNDELAAKLQLATSGEEKSDQRRGTVEQLVDKRKQTREKELLAIKAQMNSDGGIAGLFETCIRCHNCMNACPICYCKTCLFRTAAFDHQPEHYLTAARRKGAVRMLGDTLLFHMTRLNHMSASCVSCGMCTSACPSDIQVGAIFSAVGEQVQAAFGYVPGQDPAEPLPLITFQANEWTEVGEAK
jgi:formate dehydrogenase subunit beta